MSAHYLLSASGAHEWVKCHGSILLTAGIPEPDGDEAKDGTASHEIASYILDTYKTPGARLPAATDFIGRPASNGVIVTEEMYRGARMYVDDVLQTCQKYGGLADLQVEQPVHAKRIDEQCGGTPDTWLWVPSIKHLFVWDYKYGFRDVAAFENWQMTVYTAGIFDQLGIDGANDSDVTVTMRAIQPRCFTFNGPYKEWTIRGSDLRSYFIRLKNAAGAALSANAVVQSGDQCRYCPARHLCPSARKAAFDGVQYVSMPTPEPLTDDALSFEGITLREATKAIKYRLEAIDAEIEQRIAAGRNIAGFITQQGQGHRKFNVATDAIRDMGAVLGVSLLADPEPVSPAEAERRLQATGMTKKDAEATLAPLTHRPSTGIKIVADPNTNARRIFSQEL